MRHIPEILSPAGDLTCLKAAVCEGADAVYFGGEAFNARRSAHNFSLEDIKEAIRLCSLYGVKTNFTLNTLIKETEWPALCSYLDEVAGLGLDAFIIQDLGVAAALAAKLKDRYPSVALHASTQMAVEDLNGVRFLTDLGFSRVVLAREVSIEEIRRIKEACDTEIEVFVHGALCYSDSGRCLMSSFHGGRSGNRGGCAQPCRLAYEIDGKTGCYLNLKDRWGLESLEELAKAGVDSLKIEGRMKGVPYVAGVTRFYRTLLDQYQESGRIAKASPEEIEKVRQLFNRGDFTDGYFHQKQHMIESGSPKNQGIEIGEVFSCDKGRVRIRSRKVLHGGDELEIVTGERGQAASIRLQEAMISRDGKEASFKLYGKIKQGQKVRRIVDPVLNEALKKEAGVLPKIPVDVSFTAQEGSQTVLEVSAQTRDGKTVSACAKGQEASLAQKAPLTREEVEKRLGKMGESVFEMRGCDVKLGDNLFLPVSALNELRRNALAMLEEKLCAKDAIDSSVLEKRTSLIQASEPECTATNDEASEPDTSVDQAPAHDVEGLVRGFEWLLTDPAQWDELKNENLTGLERIVIDLEAFADCDKAALAAEMRKAVPNAEIMIRLPLAGRMTREDKIREELEDWMKAGVTAGEACRLGQIRMLREMGMNVFAGPDLGVMNETAARFMSAQTEGYFLSRELSMKEIRQMKAGAKTGLVVFGRVPYMVTEQCVYKERYGCKKSPEGHVTVMKDRAGEKMPVVSHCKWCYSEIYSEEPVCAPPSALEFAGLKRIEWTLEKGENCRLIWRALSSGHTPEGYKMRGHFEKEVE